MLYSFNLVHTLLRTNWWGQKDAQAAKIRGEWADAEKRQGAGAEEDA